MRIAVGAQQCLGFAIDRLLMVRMTCVSEAFKQHGQLMLVQCLQQGLRI